jgi:tRNA(Arg) A34 adenosine deaminase TadA
MNKYMRMAINEARKGIRAGHGGPFGAVIVKDGEVIGKGHNQVLKNNDPTCHGEMMAIHKACKKLGTYDLSGCELYTSCYPCPMCLSAIIWANIKKVYYGNTKEDASNIGFRDEYIYDFIKNMDKENNVLELECMDREETIKTFNEYKEKSDKKIY